MNQWTTLWGYFESYREDDRRLLTGLAFAFAVPILMAYGAAGFVYGHLEMLTPLGFISLHGASAWLAAMASFSLAIFTVRGLFVSPQHRPRARSLQIKLLLLAVIATLCALIFSAFQSSSTSAFTGPGIAPRSEWLLLPLPYVWRWLLPLSRDFMGSAFFLVGGVVVVFSVVLDRSRVRGAWMPVGAVVPLLVAFAYLGSAAYDYAAARGLGALHDTDAMQAFAANPGRHNVHTFISLWTAITCLTTVPILCSLATRFIRTTNRKS